MNKFCSADFSGIRRRKCAEVSANFVRRSSAKFGGVRPSWANSAGFSRIGRTSAGEVCGDVNKFCSTDFGGIQRNSAVFGGVWPSWVNSVDFGGIRLSWVNSAGFGRIRLNSAEFGGNRPNSAEFGGIWPSSRIRPKAAGFGCSWLSAAKFDEFAHQEHAKPFPLTHKSTNCLVENAFEN